MRCTAKLLLSSLRELAHLTGSTSADGLRLFTQSPLASITNNTMGKACFCDRGALPGGYKETKPTNSVSEDTGILLMCV